jgi:Zn-dependent protease
MTLAFLSPDELRWGAVVLILLIVSVGLHEFGHAWVADLRGDPLPRAQGRVTLDPFAHADPIGTILIPAIGIFGILPFGIIGWGKPVQVLLANPRTRKVDDILITLAGPAMNLVQCLAFALIGLALLKTGHLVPNAQRVIETGITLNAGLMVFNLVPIPPLDGSRVLRHLLGLSEEIFSAIARFAPLILIVLINLPFFSQALSSLIFLVATPFFALAGLLP